MSFELKLNRLADSYAEQGYRVTIRPGPEVLPPFAKDFQVEILGERGAGGVLVSVKNDRGELAADSNLTRYAEIIGSQKAWRFDFAILEAEKPNPREIDNAEDLSEADMDRSFDESTEMLRQGFHRPALITAWAGFEAAMRSWLRAAGEQVGWGSTPQGLVTGIFANGIIDIEEYHKLEALARVRNQIVHGYVSSPTSEAGAVPFLCEIGRRLIEESRNAIIRA